MKILYITNMYPNHNDPTYGVFVKEQIEAIERMHNIDKVIYVIEGKNGLLEYVKSVLKIRSIIRKGKFDLVHIHYGLSGLFLLLGRVKVPVLLTLHGGDIQKEQGKEIQVAITKKILKNSDFAITLNNKMDYIAKQFVRDTEIIPCSVNVKLFVPEKKHNDASKKVKVLFPSARTRYVKDYPLFQKTCEVLRQRYNLGVEEYFMENLTRQQCAVLYNQMDVLLMTSISEGSPQVVKEAMACNLPVVTTDVGDVRVLLDGVRDSYVSVNRDEKELADLVFKSLYENKEGVSPRNKIFELGLDDDSVAHRIFHVYNRLIKNERT